MIYCVQDTCMHVTKTERSDWSALYSGVASMEQMEQLLPRNAKGHLYNSCRSEIFMGKGER